MEKIWVESNEDDLGPARGIMNAILFMLVVIAAARVIWHLL